MAKPFTINDDTGEIHVLNASGQWEKAKRAENPNTGEKYYFDGAEWQSAPLSKRQKEAGRAAATMQGVTAGFGDEVAASLENPWYALKSVAAQAAGYAMEGPASFLPGRSGDMLTSRIKQDDPTGAANYSKDLEQFRQTEADYARAEPVTSLAINVASGIPTALATGGAGTFSKASTTAQRLQNAAKSGAAFGAVAGFGAGEGGLENRIGSSAVGATVGGAVGAGLQILSPVVQPIYRAIKSALGPRIWDTRTSTFTTEGRKILIQSGLDPDKITRELGEQFAREAQLAANPSDAAALASARSLPRPVPLTSGQITGDPAQQLFEDMARQGTRGQAARTTIESADDATRRALFGNLDAVQAEIAQGGATIARGEGMQAASSAVNRRAGAFEAKVNALYDAARKGGDAMVERSAYAEGVRDIAESLTDFSPTNIPKVQTALARMFGHEAANGRPTQMVSNIFQARAEMTALQAEGGVEGAAASRAKAALDRFINSLGQNSLHGSPETIKRWFNAIAARREYGRKFGSGIVADLIERDPKAGWRLVIDPADAATRILGDGSKALSSKSDLARNLMQLRSRLGADSKEWLGVRQEMFLRLAREARGGIRSDGEYQFSAPKFIKAFDDFVEKNKAMARLMFSDREFKVMRQLREVAGKTIVKPGGRQLGSAAALQATVAKVFPMLARGLNVAVELPPVKGVINTPYAARAAEAAAGGIPQARASYGMRNLATAPAAYQATREKR